MAKNIVVTDEYGTAAAAPELANLKVAQLRVLAQQLGIRGYLKLKKAELVQALEVIEEQPIRRMVRVFAVSGRAPQIELAQVPRQETALGAVQDMLKDFAREVGENELLEVRRAA